ncbi:MAG: hypothetical protein AAB973_03995 [Patescibacteria group bacterium]
MTKKSKIDKEPWGAYLAYVVRKGYEDEDVRTAKRWARKVRESFPELANKFEEWAWKVEHF